MSKEEVAMRYKNISAILLFTAVILWPIRSYSEPFPMPRLPKRETRVVKIHYEGKKIKLEKATLSQKLLYKESPHQLESDMHWVGEGSARQLEFVMVERLNSKNTNTNTFTFKASNSLILEKFEKVVTSPSGKRLRREYYDLRHPAQNFPEDLMHTYTMEIAFRGLKLDQPGSVHRFYFWIPPAMVIPMLVKVKKTETLELPIGSRKCHRVEIKPDMSALLGKFLGRIIQPLIPSYLFWLETRGTHPLLKYKGPLGKINIIGAPDEIYQTVKIDPDPAR